MSFFKREWFWIAASANLYSRARSWAIWPGVRLGFYTDDYSFADMRQTAARHISPTLFRSNQLRALLVSSNPGTQWRLAFIIFGSNPFGYHALNVGIHLVNCILLLLLVKPFFGQMVGRAVCRIVVPDPSAHWSGVFWPGIADPMMTMWFLASVGLWTLYLESGTAYVRCGDTAYVCGYDCCQGNGRDLTDHPCHGGPLVAAPVCVNKGLVLRYLPLAGVLVPYGIIEYLVSQRGVYVGPSRL